MSEHYKVEYFTPEKQEARCFLRERFLRSVGNLVGKKCTFHMHSNTTVTGIFRGSDIEFKNLLVDNLTTPFAVIPHSRLRASDVHYFTYVDGEKD